VTPRALLEAAGEACCDVPKGLRDLLAPVLEVARWLEGDTGGGVPAQRG
jgi:hypothetical protein